MFIVRLKSVYFYLSDTGILKFILEDEFSPLLVSLSEVEVLLTLIVAPDISFFTVLTRS